jgi:hypothetical protein
MDSITIWTYNGEAVRHALELIVGPVARSSDAVAQHMPASAPCWENRLRAMRFLLHSTRRLAEWERTWLFTIAHLECICGRAGSYTVRMLEVAETAGFSRRG